MRNFSNGGFRNSGLAIALGASLLILADRPGMAADATFVGRLALAVEDDVAAKLGLSETVKAQLQKIADDRETAALELSLKLKGRSPAEQEAQLAPFRAESEKIGLKLLSDAQRKQLEQIRLQRQGMASLTDPEMIGRLKLTAEQQAQAAKLLDQRDGELDRAADAAAKRAIRADYERKLSAVLTGAQRTTWDDLATAATGSASPVAGNETSPSAEKPLDTKPGNTANAEPSKISAASTTAKKPAEPRGNPEELKFNFRFAPWKEVLEWFAQQADLSLVMDSPPPGTFNYQDTKAYSPADAIDLLNSVLLTKGYTLVRRDRLLMLVNLQDGVPANLVPTVSLEELDKRGKYELVSVVFRPVKLSPEEADAEIRKLLGPQGSVVVLAKAGQLVVTETAGRLRTIRDVLKAIEDPQGTFTDRLQTFTFKYAVPGDALTVIKQLLNIPADKNTSSDGTLRLALDASSGKLLVSGKGDAVKRVEDIIKMIDVPGQGGSALAETPQLEIYSITSADPASVLQVLQTLLAGLPDVRLTTDPKTGNLIALARPSQHATIRATLAQMQRDARQVEVMHLHTLDPNLAMVSINKVFAADGEAGPKIEADASQHQLIVRGTEAQIMQIRGLLEKMGETAASPAGDDKHVRVLPLTGRAGRTALEQIEQLWPTMHKNKIRVIAPASGAADNAGAIEEKGTPNQRPAIPGIRQVVPPSDPTPRSPAPQFGPPAQPQPTPTGPPPAAPAVTVPPAAAPPIVPPQAAPVTPEGRNAAARPEARRVRAMFANQTLENAPADPPSAATPAAPAPKPAAATPAEKTPAAGGEAAPIIVTITPNGVIIASDDLQALDDFEALLNTLSAKNTTGREFTVFYLKYAKAAAVSELLGEIFGGSSGGSSSGGGSLLGNIAGAALGGDAGGLMGSLLGGGGGDSAGPAHVTATGPISIVPDSRLNALVVQANSADLDTVEQLLKVLDQKNGPEEVSVVARPQLIPIRFTSADTIAAVVRQVYQDRLAVPSNAQRQPSPVELFQMMRGGGGRGGRGGAAAQAGRGNARQNTEDETPKMTVGVDTRTNSLVVSAPDPLFNEVRNLVAQLDQPDPESNQTMEVVTVKRTSPEAVQQALSAMMGSGVRASVVPAATTSSAIPGNGTPNGTVNNQRGDASRGGYGSGGNNDASRRRSDFFNALQQGMGDGNSGFQGGGLQGGGFQGGGFQGGFRGFGGGNQSRGGR